MNDVNGVAFCFFDYAIELCGTIDGCFFEHHNDQAILTEVEMRQNAIRNGVRQSYRATASYFWWCDLVERFHGEFIFPEEL